MKISFLVGSIRDTHDILGILDDKMLEAGASANRRKLILACISNPAKATSKLLQGLPRLHSKPSNFANSAPGW